MCLLVPRSKFCLQCFMFVWRVDILVPVSFKGSGGVLAPATILVDTDAMANFLHKAFIRKHDLCLQKQSAKSIVLGFKQDWSGHIQLLTLDSKPFNIQISFSVTQLGLVDAIFGLPW